MRQPDNLRQYVSLRDAILQERTQIEQRLREINQALGQMGGAQLPPQTDSRAGPRGRGARNRNAISLHDAVIQVVKNGPLSKKEILSGVENLGYKFTTKDPINSLGVILYGKNPKFANEGGRFGLPDGYVPSEPKQRGRPVSGKKPGKGRGGRRPMSPEAKAKIAAAARARWARWRASNKK